MRRKAGSDDGRAPEYWRGERRSNETRGSSTDPDPQLYRKSNAAPALPNSLGHVATNNRHGLVVGVQTTNVTGTAEREAAAAVVGELAVRGPHIILGADTRLRNLAAQGI